MQTNAIGPLVFVSIAYALSIALSLLIGLTGGHESHLIGLGYLSMFLPTAAVVIVSITMHETPRIDWTRLPVKYVPLALFLMPLAMHAAMLSTAAVLDGSLRWQPWLTPQADGLYHTPAERGWGELTAGGLAGRIVLNALVGLMIVSILALFEEIGWRAWLLPRLAARMGARRAIVVGAIFWAYWHVPFALSGIQYVGGISAARTAIVMPLGIAGVGIIIGWLWMRTESIWIVALAHGALNNWGQYAFKYLQDTTVARPELLLVAGGLPILIIGIVLLRITPDTKPLIRCF